MFITDWHGAVIKVLRSVRVQNDGRPIERGGVYVTKGLWCLRGGNKSREMIFRSRGQSGLFNISSAAPDACTVFDRLRARARPMTLSSLLRARPSFTVYLFVTRARLDANAKKSTFPESKERTGSRKKNLITPLPPPPRKYVGLGRMLDKASGRELKRPQNFYLRWKIYRTTRTR